MTTNKATYARTQEKRSSDAATFTTQPVAEPFGWQGDHAAHRSQTGTPRAQPSSLGNLEPGRIADFEQGVHEAFDHRARTAAVMVGTYAAVRSMQHWHAWRRQQGR